MTSPTPPPSGTASTTPSPPEHTRDTESYSVDRGTTYLQAAYCMYLYTIGTMHCLNCTYRITGKFGEYYIWRMSHLNVIVGF